MTDVTHTLLFTYLLFHRFSSSGRDDVPSGRLSVDRLENPGSNQESGTPGEEGYLQGRYDSQEKSHQRRR